MAKAQQWTAFLDMLGFSRMNSKIDDQEKADDLIEFLESNFSFSEGYDEHLKESYAKDTAFDLHKFYTIKRTHISDSVVITFKPNEIGKIDAQTLRSHSANAFYLLCNRINLLSMKLAIEKGLLLRGGISTEFCEISGNYAVGKGLTNAYLAESTLSDYPRISLAKDLSDRADLISDINKLYSRMYCGAPLIIQRDGAHMVNSSCMMISQADPSSPSVSHYIRRSGMSAVLSLNQTSDAFERHFKRISNILKQNIKTALTEYRESSDQENKKNMRRIVGKYRKLRKYHNESIGGLSRATEYKI